VLADQTCFQPGLDCVFYLYPTLEAARVGESSGGSGFFVGSQMELNKPWQQIYAVSNLHCIVEAGPEIVLRINKSNDQLDYITTRKADWITHENRCDVAVLPIALAPEHKYNFISSHLFFLTPEIISHCAIGPGDDVFMVGRFIGHDGKQSNLPTARFGNISRMDGEPIEDKYGIRQDSFLVDIRSISGYSGSPVFVYIQRHGHHRHCASYR
jgi:Trypsin-like peptidase domain